MVNKKQCRYSLSTTLCVLLTFIQLFSILGNPKQLSANQVYQYGCSPRGIAMGNAYNALSGEVAGFMYNPAGPATHPRTAFMLGYLYNKPEVNAKGPGVNNQTNFDNSSRFPVLGFTWDFGPLMTSVNEMIYKLEVIPEALRPDITAVFCMMAGLSHGGRVMMKTNINVPDDVHFPVFKGAPDVWFLGAGASIKLHDKLYFGGGMQPGTTCHLPGTKMSTIMDFDRTDYSLASGSSMTIDKLALNTEMELNIYTGIILKPWEKLRLGLTWREEYHCVTFMGDIQENSPSSAP